MATAAKKTNHSFVRNPANKTATVAAKRTTVSAKTNAGRKTTKKHATKRRNPTLVTKTYRKKIRRNPNMNNLLTLMLSGIASGMTLGGIDTVINFLAPSAGENAQILIKAGGAWAVHTFGEKVPFLKPYKNHVAGLLAIFAGYDLYRYKVAPVLASSHFQLPFGLSNVFQGQGNTQALQPAPVIVQQAASMPQPQLAPQHNAGSFINDQGQLEWYIS